MELRGVDLINAWATIRLVLALGSFCWLWHLCLKIWSRELDNPSRFVTYLFLSNILMNLVFILSVLGYFFGVEGYLCPALGVIDVTTDFSNIIFALAFGFACNDQVNFLGRTYRISQTKRPCFWFLLLSFICLLLGISIYFVFEFGTIDFKCYVSNRVVLLISEVLICTLAMASFLLLWSKKNDPFGVLYGNKILAMCYSPFVVRDFLTFFGEFPVPDIIFATLGYISMSMMGILYSRHYEKIFNNPSQPDQNEGGLLPHQSMNVMNVEM